MQNGFHKTLKYVLGATRQSKDPKVAISWLAYVGKVFVICVANLGNQITKIILSATFIGRKMMMTLVNKKQFFKN